MSNSELNLLKLKLENEFNVKKREILKLLEDTEKISTEFNSIENELNKRKSLI